VRLALFGRGRMGRAIQDRAREAGWEIGAVFGSTESPDPAELARLLAGHDAAVDFSVAPAVLRHVAACAQARVPLVEGTTGWLAEEPQARRLVETSGAALLVSANFSVGVQLFYRIVDRAAELFAGLGAYDVFVEEAHHATKRDAPSGTARELERRLAARLGHAVPVSSTRAGHIPGVHRVGFDSAADQILLIHTARARDGFAAGALAAARWLCGRAGMYTFEEMLDEILKRERGAP
jgi:4-hydroxy-tetrahydrodipicolinate reductase